MSFFKNITDLAGKASIPKLKEDRNVLEAQKLVLEEQLKKENERVALVKTLVDQMKAALEANTKAVAELQAVFRTQKFTPATAVEDIAGNENVQQRNHNLLYNHLVQANVMLTSSIAETDDSKAGEYEKQIRELTAQIAKFNEKLKKIREGK
jgi:chromosome segregation ATPase